MRAALVLCLAGLALSACAKSEEPAPSAVGQPVFVKRSLRSRWFGREFDRTLMKDDYRAVAVPVDADQISIVRTGDRIDLISIFEASRPGGGVEKLAATVLQNAEVLGVRAGAKSGGATLVLRLNPYEAQYAALAVKQGELFVALRKEGDIGIHPLEMASFRKLFL